ncbi:hypothetical protein AOLI_G00133300 [Acnodon oligacanthus]
MHLQLKKDLCIFVDEKNSSNVILVCGCPSLLDCNKTVWHLWTEDLKMPKGSQQRLRCNGVDCACSSQILFFECQVVKRVSPHNPSVSSVTVKN